MESLNNQAFIISEKLDKDFNKDYMIYNSLAEVFKQIINFQKEVNPKNIQFTNVSIYTAGYAITYEDWQTNITNNISIGKNNDHSFMNNINLYSEINRGYLTSVNLVQISWATSSSNLEALNNDLFKKFRNDRSNNETDISELYAKLGFDVAMVFAVPSTVPNIIISIAGST